MWGKWGVGRRFSRIITGEFLWGIMALRRKFLPFPPQNCYFLCHFQFSSAGATPTKKREFKGKKEEALLYSEYKKRGEGKLWELRSEKKVAGGGGKRR